MSKKLQLSKGWIKSQTVDFLYQGQKLLVSSSYGLTPCIVNHDIDSPSIKILINNVETTVDKSELRRLVVTDGTRFVPLQHEDWQEALDKKFVDSLIVLDYFIIERKAKSGTSIIRLGRIYKPDEKERKIAQLAYDAGEKDALYRENNPNYLNEPTRSFDEYWKNATVELELAD